MRRTSARFFRTVASAAVLVGVAATSAEAATVSGKVLDTSTNLPLAGVEVLVDGAPTGVTTDASGQFTAEVPGGERLFTFRRTGYSEQSLGPLAVAEEGEATVPDAKLAPMVDDEVYMLDELSVEGRIVANSVVAVRQRADVSVDMLSAVDFSKFTGTDVADIVVRIPGLSTTSRGSFAVVRGLAERYNPVMLDGIVLPSSDPERQSPQLDIFPARLVDAIVITKAYEPRLPGTSSGAAIDLRTRPIPEQRKTEVQFGLRADEGWFKNDKVRSADVGGSWDNFGLGARDRASAPGAAPGTSTADRDRAQLAYVKSPSTVNGLTETRSLPLGGRFAFTHEDVIALDENTGRAFGYSFSYSQDRSASSESGFRQSFGDATQGAFADGTATRITNASSKEYEEFELENRWGALASVGYSVNEQHQFRLNAFWSQVGLERYSREYNGLSAQSFASLQTAQRELEQTPGQAPRPELNVAGLQGQDEIYYSQRHLFNLSGGGEHDLRDDINTRVSWTLARLQARQEEPEYLIQPYRYSRTPFGLTQYTSDYGGSQGLDPYTRYWRDTQENTLAGRLDLETEADRLRDGTRFRYGYYFDRTKRDYTEDSFSLTGPGVTGFSFEHFLYEQANAPLPPAGYGVLNFGSPFAEAERKIDAGYLSGTFEIAKDRPYAKSLTLLAGLRVEDFSLTTTGAGRVGNVTSDNFYRALHIVENGSPVGYVVGRTTFDSRLDETAYLPAVALNYSPREGYNVRVAFSETTARPSFREVGSYFTIDRVANEYVHGNDQLRTSEVRSYDLRFEYFRPNSTDTVAVSFFHKNVSNPIERISIYEPLLNSVSTFFNNENDATIRGIELEGAKGLGILGEWAEPLTFGGNFTFIDAQVSRDSRYERRQVTPSQDGDRVPDKRPLYDQPEFIANLYLSYDIKPLDLGITLSYFAISDTLLKVNELVWDTYTEAHSRWDLTLVKRFGKHWRVNASARNLFNPERRLIADPDATAETIVYRTYKDGRSYTLSATYQF